MKPLSLAYSPCPNDTFIFYALVHGKISTQDLKFKEILLDIETLNHRALNAELDITKISYHAFGHLRETYRLLRAGSALGRGCGPLVISKHTRSMEELQDKRIAIPGKLTTAHLLLQLYNSHVSSRHSAISSRVSQFTEMPFDRIVHAVAREEVDAGLIIHESRFTYQSFGLYEIIDLGAWWERETGLPIPLGGIIARKSLGEDTIEEISSLIRQSVAYARAHRSEPMDYIKQHSQELSDDVIRRHIDLYVNEFSLDVGGEGARAIDELLLRAEQAGIIPEVSSSHN
jgi:1,4-dihydroxy-6-naphthoate synthase